MRKESVKKHFISLFLTDRESGDEVWQDILRMEREENNAEKYPTAEG